jgi:DNA-binding transcriptional LysR family regulator
MKLAAFRTLSAVLRTGSFAGAAAEMNLSPSAVSLQMKHLEAYFGQPLFDRSALSVRPTAFAAEAGATLHEVLDRVDALRRRGAPAVAGKLRVGIIEPLQVSLLPAFLHEVRQRYPHLDVRLVRGRANDLVESLKRGEIDAAIVVQPETGGSRRLHWTPLAREKLVLIAPPLARETGAEALFRAYEWIRFDKTTIGGRIAARYVAGVAPRARCRIDLLSLPAIVAMVSEGHGVSVLPEPGPNLLAVHPVRCLSLGANGPYRQIAFVCRRNDADAPMLQALVASARRAYGDRTPGA